MNRIQSNQNKLSEIEKTLAIIQTEEEGIKKRIYASSVFDKRLEKERFCGPGRGNLKLEEDRLIDGKGRQACSPLIQLYF